MSVFLSTNDLAERWQVSTKTLSNWRGRREGPTYCKIGKNVLYRLTDIESYEEENLKRNSVA